MKSGGRSKRSIKPWILAAWLLSTTLGETSAMADNPIPPSRQPVSILQAGDGTADVSQEFHYKLVKGTECAGGKCGTISATKEPCSDPRCTHCNPKSKMKDEKTLGTSQGNDTEAVPSGTGHVPPIPSSPSEGSATSGPAVSLQSYSAVDTLPAPEGRDADFIDAPDPKIIVKDATRDAFLIHTPVSVEEETDSESLSGEEDNADIEDSSDSAGEGGPGTGGPDAPDGRDADDEEIPVEHSLEETNSESDVYSEEYSNGYLEDGVESLKKDLEEDIPYIDDQDNEENELSTDSRHPEDGSKEEGKPSENDGDSQSDANDQSLTNDSDDYSESFGSMFGDGPENNTKEDVSSVGDVAENTSTNDGDSNEYAPGATDVPCGPEGCQDTL